MRGIFAFNPILILAGQTAAMLAYQWFIFAGWPLIQILLEGLIAPTRAFLILPAQIRILAPHVFPNAFSQHATQTVRHFGAQYQRVARSSP